VPRLSERTADERPATLPAPYPGLVAYQDSDEDAALFFGRGAERDLIIANLRSARVTVLYGPSGVGKSSLLRAGVVHGLRTEPTPASALGDEEDPPRSPVVLLDDWTGEPGRRLVSAIEAAAGHAGDGAAAGLPATDALERLRSCGSGAVLLILDQFEEYLRVHPQPRAGGLDDVLSTLVSQPDVVVRVLMAVREDRLAGLDRFEGRIPDLLRNPLRLGPLGREAAREAIERPVERYNAWVRERHDGREVTPEPGLADDVLDELGHLDGAGGDSARNGGGSAAFIEPAVLALTMRRLWDADIGAGGTTLRRSTLAALGGASRIFATHLDASMAALPAADQRLAADVLRFLVTPSGVIRSYSAADLSAYVGRDEPAVEALAETLSRPPARVLRATAAPAGGEPRVDYELAHQVLARPALDWRARFEVRRLERRARRLILGLVAVSALALALIGYVLQAGPLGRLELRTVDARFAIRGAQAPDRSIVLVTYDHRAPRARIARALEDISAAGPRVIAADIAFIGATKSRAGDAALIRAVHRIGAQLVLATDTIEVRCLREECEAETELFGRKNQIFSDRDIHGKPAVGSEGFPATPNVPATVVRTMLRSFALGEGPSGEAVALDTFGVLAASRSGLSSTAIGALPASTWIAFRGGPGTFPRVALADVLAARPGALGQLRNRIVVLGVTAEDDVHSTSAPGGGLMTGPELQANAISTALRGFPLRDAGRGVDVALIIMLGLVPLALALRFAPLPCALGVLAAAALFCIAAQLTFDAGRVVNVVYPLLSLALSAVGVLTVSLLRARSASRARGEPARPAVAA
jgi:CHASE2 domain-containing sensor protein